MEYPDTLPSSGSSCVFNAEPELVGPAFTPDVAERNAYFGIIAESVDLAISRIAELSDRQLYDARFLEHEVIPQMGLNNEYLWRQPNELTGYLGKGLHLWQFPHQFANYLVWLTHNAREISSLLEIGVRWGGSFIIVTEWLRRIGAPLQVAVAADPIGETALLKRYRLTSQVPIVFWPDYSNAPGFGELTATIRPEMVVIDGDTSMSSVMLDHLQFRETASIIVHNDIASQAAPDPGLFWAYASVAETDFQAVSFTEQYDDVPEISHGIGVLKRRADRLPRPV